GGEHEAPHRGQDQDALMDHAGRSFGAADRAAPRPPAVRCRRARMSARPPQAVRGQPVNFGFRIAARQRANDSLRAWGFVFVFATKVTLTTSLCEPDGSRFGTSRRLHRPFASGRLTVFTFLPSR